MTVELQHLKEDRVKCIPQQVIRHLQFASTDDQ